MIAGAAFVAGMALAPALTDSTVERLRQMIPVTPVTGVVVTTEPARVASGPATIRVFRDRAEGRSVGESGVHVPAAVVDSWVGPDKVKHFFTSAFLQGAGYGSFRATNLGHGSSVLGASLGTTAIGLLKELRDTRSGGQFSIRDLAWNTAGAAAATVLLERTRR